MEFGRWYPLTAAADHAPAAPGVLQLRVRIGLVDYPRGKSAMVHYAVAEDVRAAALALAAANPDADWLCRHLSEPCDLTTAVSLEARLVRDFTARFGVAPTPLLVRAATAGVTS